MSWSTLFGWPGASGGIIYLTWMDRGSLTTFFSCGFDRGGVHGTGLCAWSLLSGKIPGPGVCCHSLCLHSTAFLTTAHFLGRSIGIFSAFALDIFLMRFFFFPPRRPLFFRLRWVPGVDFVFSAGSAFAEPKGGCFGSPFWSCQSLWFSRRARRRRRLRDDVLCGEIRGGWPSSSWSILVASRSPLSDPVCES